MQRSLQVQAQADLVAPNFIAKSKEKRADIPARVREHLHLRRFEPGTLQRGFDREALAIVGRRHVEPVRAMHVAEHRGQLVDERFVVRMDEDPNRRGLGGFAYDRIDVGAPLLDVAEWKCWLGLRALPAARGVLGEGRLRRPVGGGQFFGDAVEDDALARSAIERARDARRIDAVEPVGAPVRRHAAFRFRLERGSVCCDVARKLGPGVEFFPRNFTLFGNPAQGDEPVVDQLIVRHEDAPLSAGAPLGVEDCPKPRQAFAPRRKLSRVPADDRETGRAPIAGQGRAVEHRDAGPSQQRRQQALAGVVPQQYDGRVLGAFQARTSPRALNGRFKYSLHEKPAPLAT